MSAALEQENRGYVTTLDGGTLIVRLTSEANMLWQDVPAINDLLDIVKRASEDDRVRGLLYLKPAEYDDDAAARRLLQGVEDASSPTAVAGRVFRHENLLGQVALAALRCPKPIISAMDGQVTANHLGMMLASDFRICTGTTEFTFPFLEFGLPPSGVASFFMERQLGYAAAAEVFMVDGALSAEEAKVHGLVTEVVGEGELVDRALARHAALAKLSPVGLTAMKRLMLEPVIASFEDHLNRSREVIQDALNRLVG